MSSLDERSSKEFLRFGQELISDAKELILDLWQKPQFESELKEDQTPVSEVDLRCEELIRKKIKDSYPEHGMIGEEFGEENSSAEFVWTIDPIDGTQNLINRIPTFGIILGLLHHGKPVLGWINHPVQGDNLYGGPGVGSFYNGSKIELQDISSGLTDNDVIGTNCPATFSRGGHLDVLDKVLKFHPHIRMYYDVYSHNLAIRGCLAAMLEYNLKIWDLAASQALVEGAGGLYKELGRESVGSYSVHHAVFGKPKAVELLSAAISN